MILFMLMYVLILAFEPPIYLFPKTKKQVNMEGPFYVAFFKRNKQVVIKVIHT